MWGWWQKTKDFWDDPYNYIERGNPEMLARKIQSGAFSASYCCGNRYDLLCSAIDQRKPKMVVALLQNGANPNVRQHFVAPVYAINLAFSIRYDPALLKLLVSYGADYSDLRAKYSQAPVLAWLNAIADACAKANGFFRQGEACFAKNDAVNAINYYERALQYLNALLEHEQVDRSHLCRTDYIESPEYSADYTYRINTATNKIKCCQQFLQQAEIDRSSLSNNF